MNIGNKVKIIESAKNELIESYQFRKGLSGVNPKDINKEFEINYFEGSNISVKNTEGVEYSLNKRRFELISK